MTKYQQYNEFWELLGAVIQAETSLALNRESGSTYGTRDVIQAKEELRAFVYDLIDKYPDSRMIP